jgi:hypothetical protein
VDDLIAFLRARLDDEQAEIEPRLRYPYEGYSDDDLHQRRAHLAYEYRTTGGQRKAWPYVDDPPGGDGWELNTTSADPDAFLRLDYTEERYWRRLLPDGPREWTPPLYYVRRAADVAAKRQIIDEHQNDQGRCAVCADPPQYDATWHPYPCTTLRLLALPYADHPDYREEWRP